MQLVNVFWLGLLALFGLYWWHAQGCKQRAFAAAKLHCQKMQLQMLDDSVVITNLKLARNSRGELHWQRSYQFEFSSTFDDRYTGKICLLGQQVESIELGIYRI